MNIKTRTQTIIKNNKSQFLFCLITTFILGLIAHGFMFLNNNLSHDSLKEFISTEAICTQKLQVGRIFWPTYQIITRGFITIPWMIGVLSLLYISLAVFLIVKIFNIQSKPMAILISGIFTVNLTVIALAATYIHDMDADLFSMLLAVFSVFIWKRYKFGYLVGAIPLMFAIGLYQSYISVTITLVIFILILDLLNGKNFKQVFTSGLKSVCMIIVAGILYFVTMKVIHSILNISILTNNYNSLDIILKMSFSEIIYSIRYSYLWTIIRILAPVTPFPKIPFAVFSIFVFILSAVPILSFLFNKKVKPLEKILTVVLLILLPIGMDICEILANGMSHYLMYFSLWLTYLFIVLLIDLNRRKTITLLSSKKTKILYNLRKVICLGFVILVIFGNIRTANTAYVTKSYDKDATFSLFTRITEKIENNENYVPGETKVVFVGYPEHLFQEPNEISEIRKLTGMHSICVLGTHLKLRYENYYKYVLKTPIKIVSQEEWDKFNNDSYLTAEMPVYPLDGCMKMIDGVFVVKLSNDTIMNEF